MKKLITIIILIAFIAINSTELNSQVTIGSARAPVSGAILELSNSESDGSSTKGLILPRVIIENRNELTVGKTGESVSYNPDEHIGLMVYNVGDNYHKCKSETMKQGVYVWNGTEWGTVGNVKKEEEDLTLAPGLGVIEDDRIPGRPEYYLYGTFGDDLWMLENMRADRYVGARQANEIDVELEREPRAGKGLGGIDEITYTWIYPTTVADGTNPDNFIKNKHLGYLYTLYAATRTAKPQSPADITYHVRGICPEGWTIPTEQNVKDLEAELLNNYDKYSDWPTKPSNVSYVMAPVCKMTTNNETGSFIREKGGFYLEYPGFRGNDGHTHTRYGGAAVFWLSEQRGTSNMRRRYLTSGDVTLIDGEAKLSSYFSVRCVKVGGAITP